MREYNVHVAMLMSMFVYMNMILSLQGNETGTWGVKVLAVMVNYLVSYTGVVEGGVGVPDRQPAPRGPRPVGYNRVDKSCKEHNVPKMSETRTMYV